MHGRDSSLKRVWAEPARQESPLDQGCSFRDLCPIPQRTILILQQDQIARCGSARILSRVVQEHER